MTNLRKAAELALETLENPWEAKPEGVADAIQALRQALAQPEQEPVGYVSDSGNIAVIAAGIDLDDDTPVYAAPLKREWQWLTDESIWDIKMKGRDLECVSRSALMRFAREIEAASKEKNT